MGRWRLNGLRLSVCWLFGELLQPGPEYNKENLCHLCYYLERAPSSFFSSLTTAAAAEQHINRAHYRHVIPLSSSLLFPRRSCSISRLTLPLTPLLSICVTQLSVLHLSRPISRPSISPTFFIASAMTALTPRINGAYLNHHLNQTVRLVGRIHELDVPSGVLQLITSDNKLVQVFSASLQAGEGGFDPAVYRQGGTVEVVGQLKQEDGSVQEYTAISLGDNFGQPQRSEPQHSTAHNCRLLALPCTAVLTLVCVVVSPQISSCTISL